jgi:hypothetical protein
MSAKSTSAASAQGDATIRMLHVIKKKTLINVGADDFILSPGIAYFLKGFRH